MSCQTEKKTIQGLKYATTFNTKVLGVGCDVEVVADIESGAIEATVAMRSLLRSSHVFSISLEGLRSCLEAIKSVRSKVTLLDKLVPNAADHQLNYSAYGATFIVVHPKEKKARFVLSIGAFNCEGEIGELPEEELASAIRKVEGLTAEVKSKVFATPS